MKDKLIWSFEESCPSYSFKTILSRYSDRLYQFRTYDGDRPQNGGVMDRGELEELYQKIGKELYPDEPEIDWETVNIDYNTVNLGYTDPGHRLT